MPDDRVAVYARWATGLSDDRLVEELTYSTLRLQYANNDDFDALRPRHKLLTAERKRRGKRVG
jgi:hypothetical protein